MMIRITPPMRILVAVEPVDFRCGIDGLAQLCRQRLQDDPFSGWVFVFRGPTGDGDQGAGIPRAGGWAVPEEAFPRTISLVVGIPVMDLRAWRIQSGGRFARLGPSPASRARPPGGLDAAELYRAREVLSDMHRPPPQYP